MKTLIYSERKVAYIAANLAYCKACAAHAAQIKTPGYFLSEQAFANRATIKRLNRARARARRTFDAVATESDKQDLLNEALNEMANFADAQTLPTLKTE